MRMHLHYTTSVSVLLSWATKHCSLLSLAAMYVVCNYVHLMHVTVLLCGQSVSWASVNKTTAAMQALMWSNVFSQANRVYKQIRMPSGALTPLTLCVV